MIVSKISKFQGLLNPHINYRTLISSGNGKISPFRGTVQRYQQNSSFRKSNKAIVPTPFEGVRIETSSIPANKLIKPLIFSIAFSAGSFVGVALWEYETLRSKAMRTMKKSASFSWFKNRLEQNKTEDWRKEVNKWWNNLTTGDKIFIPICIANVIVFGMWRIPRLQPSMLKYFCSNPSARAVCWPMFLSTFSHYSMFHIFANMYVLHSFSNTAVAAIGKEQFLVLYLSAGVISTFASYMYKAATAQAGLSLGASGAIMAVLALVCAKFPETQLSILFLPMFTFSAGNAIKVIMGLDLAGGLLGWKFFDHAAHLGGALFGIFWCYVGSELIWPERVHFLHFWHQLRSSNK